MAYAIGEFSVIELLKHHPKNIKEIILADTKERNKYRSFIGKITIDSKRLYKIVKKEDIYAMAIFTPYIMKLDNKSTHIVIENLDDEGEIGTIVRTAVAFDFFDIVLINCHIDLFSAKLIRASVGAFFIARIEQFNTHSDYQKKYRNKTITFVNQKDDILSLKVARDLYQFRLHQCDNC